MGGGSDAPATPDYTEVTNMLKDVFKVSTERANELWDWGKKAYETNSGIGRKAIESAMSQMTKMAADADYYRGRSKEYEGAERKQLDDAMKMGTPQYQEEQAKKATQDIASRTKAARDAQIQKLEGMGLSSESINRDELALRVQEAGMQAAGANAAREAARDEAEKRLAAAIGTGANLRSNVNPAAAGSLESARLGASIGPAIDSARVQTAGAAGQFANQAATAAGNIGNIQNMGFTNAMDKYKAEQEDDSGWMSLLGTGIGAVAGGPIGSAIGGGIGKMFGEEGGAIPEPTQMFANGGGPVPIEMSPSGGAIPDDIGATINGSDGSTQQAQINADEFIIPADVAKWMGQKQLQKLVAKAQQEMADPNSTPAAPEIVGGEGEMPPPTMDGAGIPPIPEGVA
jgi:hypothetical protein